MSPGRRGTLAAQAVVVGLLVVVVYLTLLRPDATNELFGVGVPEENGAAAEEGSRGEATRSQEPRAEGDRGRRGAGSLVEPPDAATSPSDPGVGSPTGEAAAPVGDSPTGDQYGGTVARVDAELK